MKRLLLFLVLCSPLAAQDTQFRATPVPASAAAVPTPFARGIGRAYAPFDTGFFRYLNNPSGAITLLDSTVFQWLATFNHNASIGGTLSVDSIITALRLTSTLDVNGNATIGGQALVDTLKNPLTSVVVDDSLSVMGTATTYGYLMGDATTNVGTSAVPVDTLWGDVGKFGVGGTSVLTLIDGNMTASVDFGITATGGDVVIGTVVTRNQLSIYGGANTTLGNNVGLFVSDNGSSGATGNRYSIGFNYSPSTLPSSVMGGVVSSSSGHTSTDIFFATRTVTTNTAPTERWRIKTTGDFVPSATGYDIGTASVPVDTIFTEDASVSGFANFSGTNTGTATFGAGDSIQVTLTGFTSSGIVVATYKSNTALTVLEIPIAVGNKQTDKFTIFGSNGESVDYWIAKK